MPRLPYRTLAVAEALKADDWTVDGHLILLTRILNPPRQASPLLRRLVLALHRQFPTKPYRSIDIATFLQQSRQMLRWIEQAYLDEIPAPQFEPPFWIPESSLPVLTTIGELADWLNRTPLEVERLSGRPMGEARRRKNAQNYRYSWRPKSHGGFRLLEIPKSRLKGVQRQIHSELLSQVPAHDAAHAFRAGRSIRTFLEPHVRRDWVLRLDLANFFTSIPTGRVTNVFRSLGYPELVAKLLSDLCTTVTPSSEIRGETDLAQSRRLSGRHLPQGAPTSPALANLCLHRLDRRLSGFAVKAGARYTRYADDLVLSGDRMSAAAMARFRMFILAILHSEGFSIRAVKSRFMPRGQSQRVCGLNLNESLNIPREKIDQLKAVIHRLGAKGPRDEERPTANELRNRLRGQLAFVSQINPARGARLQKQFEMIPWPDECTSCED